MFGYGNFAAVFGNPTHVKRLRAIFEAKRFREVFVDPEKTIWIGLEDPEGWTLGTNGPDFAMLTGLEANTWRSQPIEAWLNNDVHVAGVAVQAGELFVVRDPFGRMPIVGRFSFNGFCTSDLSFVDPPHVDQARLAFYLSGTHDEGRNDFVLGRQRLKPAEFWSSATGFRRYWHPNFRHDLTDRKEAAARVRGLLAQRCPPHSVVLTGGGLDSAALSTCVVSPEMWTMVAPPFPSTDESGWANQLAAFLKVETNFVDVSNASPFDGYAHVSPGEGPQDHPNEGAELRLVRAAARQRKTMLTGVGADQLFQVLVDEVWRAWFEAGEVWKSVRARGAQRRIALRVLVESRAPWLLEQIRTHRSPELAWNDVQRWVSSSDGRGACDRHNILQGWSWELSMRQLRRHSRAARADLRTPFLDRTLWDWVARVPPSWLLDRSTKTLLREAFRHHLPDTLLYRPKDSTFDELIEFGLRREANVLRSRFDKDCSLLARRGMIRLESFRGVLDTYLRQRPPTPFEPTGTVGVWRTIAAEQWLSDMKKESEAFDVEFQDDEKEAYEAPELTLLGDLGEVVRGMGSAEFDWSNGCSSTGSDLTDIGC